MNRHEGDPLMAVPAARDSSTSAEAAASVAGITHAREQRLLAWLRERGEYGATDAEIGEAFGWPGDSTRPRRWKLVKLGLVGDSGRRRHTGRLGPGGKRRSQAVWVAIQPAGDGQGKLF